MRKARIQQLPLAEATPDHPKAKEFAKISEILDNNSSIYDLVLQYLGKVGQKTGVRGMTADQVLRAAIIKQMEGFSYRALAFHLMDSRVYSKFCRITSACVCAFYITFYFVYYCDFSKKCLITAHDHLSSCR